MGCNLFNRPVVFGLCFTLFTILQVSVGIYIAGILTTLEKQFRITSSVAGLLLSTSDFASIVSIIGVTYVGKSWHRPRMVGILGLLTGIGGILSGAPHFMYPAHREGDGIQVSGNETSSTVHVCDVERVIENCTAEDISNSGSRIHEAWALLLGQAIMGFAYGPLFPIALTYIDDQVRGTTTPYYIAVILTAGTSATLFGYGQAFLFLPLDVNWPAPPDYTKEWLGAWWMGFILDGVLMLVVSIPFFFFPRDMDVEINEEDIPPEKLALEKKESETDGKLGVKDFLQAAKRVSTNFVFMVLLVGTVFELAIAATFGFYMAKFLEIQYNLPPSDTALYVGIMTTPAALFGNFAGGFIVKCLKLTSRGCGWFVVVFNIISLCFTPALYFMSCPEPDYAGREDGRISTINPCNADCTCSPGGNEPVCGANGLTYSTPCFAGCTGKYQNTTDDPAVDITVYTGCTCSAVENATDASAKEAVQGKCLKTCDMIFYAGILIIVQIALGTIAKNPLVIMTIRCVEEADKSFALGLQALFGRALGFLPAPLYLGAAIEGACILDRIECGRTGDCLTYDAQLFRLVFLGIFFGLSVGNMICHLLATVKVTIVYNKMEKEKNYEKDIELKNGNVETGCEGNYNQGYDDDEVKEKPQLTSL